MYTVSSARDSTLPYHRCGKSGLILPAVPLGLWHNFGGTAALNNTRFTDEELDAIGRASGFAE